MTQALAYAEIELDKSNRWKFFTTEDDAGSVCFAEAVLIPLVNKKQEAKFFPFHTSVLKEGVSFFTHPMQKDMPRKHKHQKN